MKMSSSTDAIRVDRRRDDRRDRLREHRHVGPEQALVFVQLAGRQLDDRLEGHPVQRPQAEEVVEHLGLDDLVDWAIPMRSARPDSWIAAEVATR